MEIQDPERLGPTAHSSTETTSVQRPASGLFSKGNRRKMALVLADLVSIWAGVMVACAITAPDLYDLGTYTLPLWLVAFTHQLLYRERYLVRAMDEASRVIKAVGEGTALLALYNLAVRNPIERSWYLAVFVAVLLTISLGRVLARRFFQRSRSRGTALRRVLIVGHNTEGRVVRDMLEADRSIGYHVVGFSEHLVNDTSPDNLYEPDAILEIAEKTGCVGVVVAATALDIGTSNRLIRALVDAGFHVELSSTLYDIAAERLTVRPLGRVPTLYIEPRQRHGWRALAKRTFDIVLTSVLLVLSAPILAIAALAVKTTSPGKVFFKQVRVGKDGETFELYKVRTMVENAEDLLDDLLHLNEADGPLFKIAEDPRITGVGRFLRRTSIDELPQFWNVLRGEMSLVGPRPALPAEVPGWDPSLHSRLRVRPGITGMWQVNGRSSARGADYAQLDLYYVDNWSLVNDVLIILRTVPAVLGQRGAM